jgi:hypothetical protein
MGSLIYFIVLHIVTIYPLKLISICLKKCGYNTGRLDRILNQYNLKYYYEFFDGMYLPLSIMSLMNVQYIFVEGMKLRESVVAVTIGNFIALGLVLAIPLVTVNLLRSINKEKPPSLGPA